MFWLHKPKLNIPIIQQHHSGIYQKRTYNGIHEFVGKNRINIKCKFMRLSLSHRRKSHGLSHQQLIKAPVCVSAVPLLTCLSANALGDAAENGPTGWDPANHVGVLDEVSGFSLAQPWLLQSFRE